MHDSAPQDLHGLAQVRCGGGLRVLLQELLAHGYRSFEALLTPDNLVSRSIGCPLWAACYQTEVHKPEEQEQVHGVGGQMVQ